MAAAIRASVAAQQQQQPQQETRKSEDREEGGRPKKEEAGLRGLEELRGPRRPARTQGEGPGELALPAGTWEVSGQLPASMLPARTGHSPGLTLGGLLQPAGHGSALTQVLLRLVGLKEASPNDPVSQEGLPTTSPATGATLPRYTRAELG